jgi:tRNA threonylcarbamoyl adenosine modification protein YeaZ
MRILALDTSSPQISVALVDGQRVLAQKSEVGSASLRLQPCIESVLKDAGLKLAQIDAFAIGEGPGSYNGLRCGFATLRGILLVHPRPVVQLNSLPAMLPATRNGKRFAGVVLDARKKVFFFQKFNTELEIPVQFEEGMRESIESIPGIDAADGIWYSYEIQQLTQTYPDAARIAALAVPLISHANSDLNLGEPRYLRPPV